MSAPHPTRARMLATIYLCSFALYVGCQVIGAWLCGADGVARNGTNPVQRIVGRSGARGVRRSGGHHRPSIPRSADAKSKG